MVGLEGFLEHTGVQGVSLLELFSSVAGSLRQAALGNIDGLSSALAEGDADVLAVLLQDLGAGGDTRVLEHGSRLGNLLLVLAHLLGKLVGESLSDLGFEVGLFLEFRFADGHWDFYLLY